MRNLTSSLQHLSDRGRKEKEGKRKERERKGHSGKGTDNNNEAECEKVQHDDHERIIALFSFSATGDRVSSRKSSRCRLRNRNPRLSTRAWRGARVDMFEIELSA